MTKSEFIRSFLIKGSASLVLLLFLTVPSRGEVGVRDFSLQSAAAVPEASGDTAFTGLTGEAALLKDNSGVLTRSVSIDMETGRLEITETAFGLPVRFPLGMPLEAYVTRKTEQDRMTMWKDTDMIVEEIVKQQGFFQIDIPVEFPSAVGRAIGRGGQLRVSGYRRIQFAGRSYWETGKDRQFEGSPDWIPNLEMDQKSEFKIEGRIGDKIRVFVDQSTERLSELENAIKINYTGDEDEIIQEIEAGNTNLSLPNTRFISASEQHKGLFGIKVKMKIGYLDLTAIASQQKGSSEKRSISPQADETEEKVYDYSYKKRSYFWIDTLGSDSLMGVDVYVSTPGKRDETYDTGYVYLDPDAVTIPTSSHQYQVRKLSNSAASPEFEFFNSASGAYIRFGQNMYVEENWTIGVAYRYKDKTTGQVTETGSYDWTKGSGDLLLKMIKTEDPDTSSPTWDYEWRNVYGLGGQNISFKGLRIEVFRIAQGEGQDRSGQNDTSYLKLLGLDGDGDGYVDIRHIDTARGLLIFPDPEPFNSTVLVEEDRLPELYRSPRLFETSKSRFYLRIKSNSIKTTYELGVMNVIQGSESVTLDGRRLSSGRDYRINYQMGTIEFLNEEVKKPGAQVNIDFEYMPFFTPDQKTLVGLRGELKFFENSHIGMTGVYRRQSSLDKRIQLGREPTQGFIWDVDGALKFKPRWMTEMVDALPLVKTQSQSRFEISGEFAQSFADPNTEGEAIVEDFEGSELTTDLGIIRSFWTESSMPESSAVLGFKPDSTLRGRLVWYNPYTREKIRNIWPQRFSESDANNVYDWDDEVNIMVMKFTPAIDSSSGTFSPESWDGVMQFLYSGYHDQTESKYLEVMVYGDDGIINIDLGEISEDVIVNGKLDHEDRNENGALEEDEDVGLDGIPDGEPGDRDDNYDYTYGTHDYDQINGTEGNRKDRMRFYKEDTEDLNQNSRLDLANQYYSISIDISDTSYVVPGTYADDIKRTSGYFSTDPGGRTNDWRLFRIPLWNMADTSLGRAGSPDPARIKYARIWVTGFSNPDSIKLASLEIVGNDWIEQAQTEGDSVPFTVSVINNYEVTGYDPPQPVEDKYIEEQGIYEIGTINEQSLVLAYEGLRPGRRVAAYNDNIARPLDFTQYQRIKFYLHGENAKGTDEYENTILTLRFGNDSLNYYGLNMLVDGGTADGWDEYAVNLARLTSLKLKAQNADSTVRSLADGYFQKTVDDTTFEVKGAPSLASIRWMEVGVLHNDFSPLSDISGEIWVDDIIVTDAKKESGVAGRLSLSTALADFVRMDGNMEFRDEGFLGLNEPVENLNRQTSSDFSGSVSLGKLFPGEWGITIPVSGGYSANERLPRYKPGTDIELLSDEDKEENRTVTASRRASVSFNKSRNSENPVVGYTVDRLSFEHSYSERFSKTTTRIDTAVTYKTGLTYDLTPRKKRTFSPLKKLKMRWVPGFFKNAQLAVLPNNFKTSFTLDDVYNKTEDTYVENATIDTSRKFTRRLDLGYNPFQSLNGTFTYNVQSNVYDDLTWHKLSRGDIGFGSELDRNQDLNLSWRPVMVPFISQNYTFATSYTESQDPKKMASAWRPGKRNISWDRRWALDYNWNFSGLKSKLPKSAKVDAKPFSGGWYWGQFKNGLSKIGDAIPTLTSRYEQSSNLSDYGLLARPETDFRFGLSDRYSVPRDTVTEGYTAQASRKEGERKELNASSSLGLGVMNLQLSYDYSFKKDEMKNQNQTTYDHSQTLPRLTLRINSLEKLPYLSEVASRSSMNSSFQSKVTETGDIVEDGLWLWYADGKKKKDSRTHTIELSPLVSWSINWKNSINTTMDYGWSRDEKRAFEFNSNINRNTKQTFTLSSQYSFTAPQGINFWKFKKIKFDKTLNTSLSVSINQTKEEYRTASDTEYKKRNDWLKWSVIPKADYRFSTKVDGGLKIEVSQNRERVQKISNNTVEVAIWAQLRF